MGKEEKMEYSVATLEPLKSENRVTGELIAALARESQTAKILDIKNGDQTRTYVQIGGDIKTIDVSPARRDHVLLGVDDFVTLVGNYEQASIWYTEDSAFALLDDENRFDVARLVMHYSDEFALLMKLREKRVRMQQREFVAMLRFDLGVAADLVARFRTVNWNASDNTVTDLKHGSDSLGKSVKAAALDAGSKELPEEIDIRVPMWKNLTYRHLVSVRCGVDIFPQTGELALIPMPGAIELQQQEFANYLGETLQTAFPERAFYGTPKR